jgi:hypothetical protein
MVSPESAENSTWEKAVTSVLLELRDGVLRLATGVLFAAPLELLVLLFSLKVCNPELQDVTAIAVKAAATTFDIKMILVMTFPLNHSSA